MSRHTVLARYTVRVAALKVWEQRRPIGRLALRWPGWTLGIRARLFLAALVTLSPLVAVLVFQDYFHLVAARQRADADATRFALMKAGDVDQYLLAIETQMAVLRAVIEADPAQASSNDALIAAVMPSLPEYVECVVAFTPTGARLGYATRSDEAGKLLPTALQDQVADTDAGRRLIVGQPLQLSPGRPISVLVSRSLQDENGASAVIILGLRPDRMPPLTDVRGLPRGSTVSIVDVRGPLLARSSTDAAAGTTLPIAGQVVPVPPRTEIARRPVTTDDRVVGHAVADRAPWVVYVDAPVEVALTAARADFVRDLVIGSVMLALALLLAWLISERITAPIRQLTADAAALGSGQLSRRTAVQSSDEIGVLASAFNETAGAIEQLVGSLHVTQAELRGLNAHLEQRVRDRTAQLNALNSELEAFSFSVSHDLRAPLRRIDHFGIALLEDYGDRLDDDGRLMLERLSAGCDQMSVLIDDLLRLSRVSRTELLYQRIDLAALANDVIAELRQAHPDQTVQVIMPETLVAHGDASLLRVVLQNLFANAWKFTRGRPDPQIHLGFVTHDDMPTFYLRDNGVGFNPAQTEKLFRPFQRLHDARDFEGTGVGLATVQRIIHRHGGRVWAEGAIGVGATFWFTLPDWIEGR